MYAQEVMYPFIPYPSLTITITTTITITILLLTPYEIQDRKKKTFSSRELMISAYINHPLRFSSLPSCLILPDLCPVWLLVQNNEVTVTA